MANYVYIATSLDGYIATKDGGIDWLMEIPNPEDSDFGFAEFMAGIDAVVMGRKSFESILGYDMWIYDKPVFVFSNTLESLPERFAGKAFLVHGTVSEVASRLAEQGYHNLYVDGGQTIRGFLAEDRIDELIITLIPILLGDGIPLFSPMDARLKFAYRKTEVYNNMFVKNFYTRERVRERNAAT